MAIVLGMLNARLLTNGTVETWFTVEGSTQLRPLLARNLDTAEQDFISIYGLTPVETAAFRAKLEHDGSASVPAAL